MIINVARIRVDGTPNLCIKFENGSDAYMELTKEQDEFMKKGLEGKHTTKKITMLNIVTDRISDFLNDSNANRI